MASAVHALLLAGAVMLGTSPDAFAQSASPRPFAPQAATAAPTRAAALDAMQRASTFMIEKVAHKGAFVWSYLPDLSRRWGEMEARETMIWIQPPGTPTMGHLFLDAYHATGDEFYYRAAEQVAGALIYAQLPAGGWNYVADYAGDQSLREWYDTVGKNGWRLEEFQHDWGNATFDDGGTAQSATLLLRMYLEKRDPTIKAALDKVIQLVLDSQYPIGAWPQRFPLKDEFRHHGRPDYTSFLTFNDDVTAGNIEFLVLCYQTLGEARFLDPIRRGMMSFVVTQMGPPQAGWALQYTPDLQPAGARSYEPKALATHTTAACIEQLLSFYRLTGDTRFLARIPEALDWLETVRLPADVAAVSGRSHPTFVELGTNKPLYVHRRGSNVVNGEYYVDGDPKNTIGHYSSFREVNVARMRLELAEVKALAPATLAKDSAIAPGAKTVALPQYFEVRSPRAGFSGGAPPASPDERAARAIATLDSQGRWITELGSTTHPYRGDGSQTVAPGDFAGTNVGDDSDTSPYRAQGLLGISTQAYIRNMGDLIRFVDLRR
jgi:PelA/Pel-15E family pectate lyase